MIEKLHISGYKSFEKIDLELKPLTILAGLNGSGKSSVIQAIRMIVNSSIESPYLDGHGDYTELKSKYSPFSEPIVIKTTTDTGDESSLLLNESTISCKNNGKFLLEYISAERFGPKSTLPICSNRQVSIGERGEFTADFINKFSSCLVNPKMHHHSTVSDTLQDQLKAWMSEISPNVSFSFQINPKHDTSHVEIDSHRATNTGFGISYSLPIVLAALGLSIEEYKNVEQTHGVHWFNRLKTSNVILLIENPEAHLHPRGQTQLGILLTMLSALNVQVIVETHSDHFIDGVRIACKEIDFVTNSNVSIKYFTKQSGESSKYKEIDVDAKGGLSDWPEGFFDQMQKNLFRLSRRK